MAALGTTICRPKRMQGMAPRATAAYADERGIPSATAASATDMVNREAGEDSRILYGTRSSYPGQRVAVREGRRCCLVVDGVLIFPLLSGPAAGWTTTFGL